MVIEDSLIGLEAAVEAKMNCVITYTGSTESQVRATEKQTQSPYRLQWGERGFSRHSVVNVWARWGRVPSHVQRPPTLA